MQSLGSKPYKLSMTKVIPTDPAVQEQSVQEDLARRVARYRERLVAEGRLNSVRSLDKAVGRLREHGGVGEGGQ